MATQAECKEFIEKIAPLAQFAYKVVGKVLPSVCIGMAAVESGWGKSESVKFNSVLGQKVGSGKTAKKYWGGAFFTTKTKEEYTVGVHTTITDAFRAYDSMQQCVLNYYELLNTKLYSRVVSGVDYKTQMRQIKLCGYMTSSTEVNSVIKIIERYNLTQYDNINVESVDNYPKTGNPYAEPTKNVRYESKGNEVRWVQYQLNLYGYGLIVDGIFGEKSVAALKNYQYTHGLLCDGICGPTTRNALISH